MSFINSKMLNLSQRAKEKLSTLDEVNVPLNIFITLYKSTIEELEPFIDREGDDYTNWIKKKYKSAKLRLKNYLNDTNYKGTFITIDDSYKILSNQPELIDNNWINAQNNYISNLSKRDILTCCGYSYVGDVIINHYINKTFDIDKMKILLTKIYPKDNYKYNLWNTHIFPFFSQIVDIVYKNNNYNYDSYQKCLINAASFNNETWINIFDLYISDLQRIIKNAPPVIKPLIVWRGAKSSRMYNYKKINKEIVNKTTQFNSTSFKLDTAIEFSGKKIGNYRCCLHQINILKGNHVLLMMGNNIDNYLSSFLKTRLLYLV